MEPTADIDLIQYLHHQGVRGRPAVESPEPILFHSLDDSIEMELVPPDPNAGVRHFDQHLKSVEIMDQAITAFTHQNAPR